MKTPKTTLCDRDSYIYKSKRKDVPNVSKLKNIRIADSCFAQHAMIISSFLQIPIKRFIGPINEKIVADLMKKHNVVPDIVKVPPKKLLKVCFPSGVRAEGGNKLTPSYVKDVPEITFRSDDDAYHLLYFSDPDTPSRQKPIFREFLLWLIANIPGNNVKEGDVICEYISPCPQRKTGIHRFVFLLFKQQKYTDFDIPHLSNRRINNRELFKLQKIIDKYKLGDPIAGNLFQAEWDEYVNVINENLSKL